MAKKDFTKMNTENIYTNTIAEATQETQEKRKTRKTYTKAEAAEFLQDMKTTGRKGVKLPRINLAFSPDLYDYIKTMSKASGQSYTEFVNKILREHMKTNQDKYQAIIDFRNSL